MGKVGVCCKRVCTHWRGIVLFVVPIILCPLLIQGSKEARCGYVVCLMAIYWMSDALPLAVTALIPVFLYPLLGIMSTEKVCFAYMKETNMMFVGGLIIAIAVEYCNLHKRIALRVLLCVGTSPKRLLLGLMGTTMFLSMWISNTACAAMMTPIAAAVVAQLKEYHPEEQQEREDETKSGETKRPTKNEIAYFLGIAFSANIGGTGTLIGTGTNLTFRGIFEGRFPQLDGIDFASWMIFNTPLMLIQNFMAWVWLSVLYMGLFSRKKPMMSPEEVQAARDIIRANYEGMGPITYHEINVLLLFVTAIFLWFFREPEFIKGWGDLFTEVNVADSTPAIFVALFLFILPANLHFLRGGNDKASPGLLNWKVVHEKCPWGLILLLGGGFAMAEGVKASGLSKFLGHQLEVLKPLPDIAILILVCVTVTFITEVSSNTAIANIVLPVLADMSVALQKHPLYFMLPATLCCSYAFMLPVATPPNAIVANACNMRTLDMVKAGFGMNTLCLILLFICYLSFGTVIYDLNHFPEALLPETKP